MNDLESRQQADPESNCKDHHKVHRVEIVEIDIPFASLASFMIRLVFAAIPALLLVAAITGGLYILIVVVWMLSTNPFS